MITHTQCVECVTTFPLTPVHKLSCILGLKGCLGASNSSCFSYAKPQILKAYVLLAADFEKNLAHTNHCVAKMLHRIGFDLGFIGMLFQASLFRVFQKLMHGALARSARFQVRQCVGVDVPGETVLL